MIQLTDKYRLTVDPQNWCLEAFSPEREVLVGKYKGNIAPASWSTVGYHATLPAAIKAALDLVTKDQISRGEVATIEELLEVYAAFAEHLLSVANITAAQFHRQQSSVPST